MPDVPTPLDLITEPLALLGAVLLLASAVFFYPKPVSDIWELFKPAWKQKDQFRKPGFELFMAGIALVGIRGLAYVVKCLIPL